MTRYLRRAFVLHGRQLAILAAVLVLAAAIVGGGVYAAARSALADPIAVPLEPVIEIHNARMTITRLRFEVEGRPASCFFTVYPDTATWRLEC